MTDRVVEEYDANHDDKKTLNIQHFLHGFRLEIVDWPKYLSMDLCIKRDNSKSILCNCNGALSEIDITDTENELVEQLVASGIDKLKYKYIFSLDKGIDFEYFPYYFQWKIDCSLNDKHYTSFGDYVPYELYSVIVVLQKNGISTPLRWKSPEFTKWE